VVSRESGARTTSFNASAFANALMRRVIPAALPVAPWSSRRNGAGSVRPGGM
jgi:hypothetical protein